MVTGGHKWSQFGPSAFWAGVTTMVTENASLVVEGHRRDSLTRDTATASAGVRWPCWSPEPKVVGSNPAWRIPLPYIASIPEIDRPVPFPRAKSPPSARARPEGLQNGNRPAGWTHV